MENNGSTDRENIVFAEINLFSFVLYPNNRYSNMFPLGMVDFIHNKLHEVNNHIMHLDSKLK